MRIEGHLPTLAPELHRLAAAATPREACGVIDRDGRIVEIANRATNPLEAFDAGALCDVEDAAGPLLAVWHTHPSDEPPSPADCSGCRATALPWIIAGPTRIWVIHPASLPYAGREFVYGVEDCWCTVSDWHAQEAGIFLPWFSRPTDKWWETSGPSPYVEAAESYGFTLAPLGKCGLGNLRRGDVILMKIAAKRTNHAALYLGGGMILHHLYGELSRSDDYDGRYQKMTTHVARHALLK